VHCAGACACPFLLTPDQEPGWIGLRPRLACDGANVGVSDGSAGSHDGLLTVSADAMIDAIRGEAAARQRLAADVLAGHASGLRRWCLIYGRASRWRRRPLIDFMADPKAAVVYKAKGPAT